MAISGTAGSHERIQLQGLLPRLSRRQQPCSCDLFPAYMHTGRGGKDGKGTAVEKIGCRLAAAVPLRDARERNLCQKGGPCSTAFSLRSCTEAAARQETARPVRGCSCVVKGGALRTSAYLFQPRLDARAELVVGRCRTTCSLHTTKLLMSIEPNAPFEAQSHMNDMRTAPTVSSASLSTHMNAELFSSLSQSQGEGGSGGVFEGLSMAPLCYLPSPRKQNDNVAALLLALFSFAYASCLSIGGGWWWCVSASRRFSCASSLPRRVLFCVLHANDFTLASIALLVLLSSPSLSHLSYASSAKPCPRCSC